MAEPRKREYTDEFIEGEFYKRFMASTPARREALLRALQAADTLAREGLDAKPARPLFEPSAPEAAAE